MLDSFHCKRCAFHDSSLLIICEVICRRIKLFWNMKESCNYWCRLWRILLSSLKIIIMVISKTLVETCNSIHVYLYDITWRIMPALSNFFRRHFMATMRHRNGRLLEPVFSGTAGVGDTLPPALCCLRHSI